jgi:hypothetical protein
VTSLERELMRMELAERAARTAARGYGINIRAYRQFFPAKAAAKETPKMGNGIKLNGDGTVTVNGTRYTRDEFRGVLEENMKAQRADPKSAYNDRRHPGHAQAVSEMALGYKFMAGELTEGDEKQIVNDWSAATQEAEVSNPQPYQQLAEMHRDPEVRAAKQRRDAGARLDDREQAIMREYDRLETANNVIGRKEAWQREAASGRKNLNVYIPGDVMPFATNQNKAQRLQQAAEHRVKVLNNPNHPYWNASSGEHKSAVLGMKIAQEMLQNGGDSFVQINPDGSINEE